MTLRRDRDDRFGSMEFVVDPDMAHHFLGVGATNVRDERSRLTGKMEAISRFLEAQTEAVTRDTVLQSITGKSQDLRAALDALIEEGYVREDLAARNGRPCTSIRPYREEDESQASSPACPESVPGQTTESLCAHDACWRGEPHGGGSVYLLCVEVDPQSGRHQITASHARSGLRISRGGRTAAARQASQAVRAAMRAIS
jgi:hypothetical protein